MSRGGSWYFDTRADGCKYEDLTCFVELSAACHLMVILLFYSVLQTVACIASWLVDTIFVVFSPTLYLA
jgi:hypothetical protein